MPGDHNGIVDVYLRDRQAGITRRISSGPNGGRSPSISADGRLVAFLSYTCNDVGMGHCFGHILVHDRAARTTTEVSVGADASSFSPAISAGGSAVAFASVADNLVPGDTNGASDVFVRDR